MQATDATRASTLSGLLVGLIGSYVGNALLFRMVVFHLGQYTVVVTAIINVIYMILLLPLLWMIKRAPLEATAPQRIFLIYAILDGASSFLAVVGAARISGPVQLLLGKMDIVAVMLGSYVLARRGLLATRFQWTHYVGAVLIMLGVFTVVVPKLASGGDRYNSVSGIFVYASSVLPGTLSMLYKEHTTKYYQISALYSNAMTAPWQFLFSLATLPLLAIPGLGGLGFHELLPSIRDGLACMFANSPSHPTDECAWAQTLMVAYVGANCVANMLMIAAVRLGSGSMVLIAGAVVLPLANVLFTQHWLMGKHATHVTWADIFALLFILAGFITYKLRPDQHEPQHSVLTPVALRSAKDSGQEEEDDML